VYAGLAQLKAACESFTEKDDQALKPTGKSTTTTSQEPVEDDQNKAKDIVSPRFVDLYCEDRTEGAPGLLDRGFVQRFDSTGTPIYIDPRFIDGNRVDRTDMATATSERSTAPASSNVQVFH